MRQNLKKLAKAKSLKMCIRVLIAFCVFSFFSSCETTDSFSCPYLISHPRVELGEYEEKYNFAGMHFSLFNDSQKTIESFTFSFMLYDSDGNNPFIGSNNIVSKCEWRQSAGTVIEYVIALDSYLSHIPEEPFVIDSMYLREIRYADGSVWKDPYGMFCVREVYE